MSLLGIFLAIIMIVEIVILSHITILLIRSKSMIEEDKKRKEFIR